MCLWTCDLADNRHSLDGNSSRSEWFTTPIYIIIYIYLSSNYMYNILYNMIKKYIRYYLYMLLLHAVLLLYQFMFFF